MICDADDDIESYCDNKPLPDIPGLLAPTVNQAARAVAKEYVALQNKLSVEITDTYSLGGKIRDTKVQISAKALKALVKALGL